MVDYLATAQRWREQWDYTGRGGVVVVNDGKVQSWVKELRTPYDWQPGCVAVDEDGKGWKAIAGTAEDGALMWLPIDPIAARRGSALLRDFLFVRVHVPHVYRRLCAGVVEAQFTKSFVHATREQSQV